MLGPHSPRGDFPRVAEQSRGRAQERGGQGRFHHRRVAFERMAIEVVEHMRRLDSGWLLPGVPEAGERWSLESLMCIFLGDERTAERPERSEGEITAQSQLIGPTL